MSGSAAQHGLVLGVDSGGSGIRVALASAGEGDGGGPPSARDPARTSWVRTSAEPAVTGARGIDARSLLGQVLPAARDLLRAAGAERCEAVCVGASGMSTLGADLRAVLPGALREALGARRLALASDAVTAYAGALGQRPGAVVAAGTGIVALGTDLSPAGGWRRADGWGHLLGDCGSGAWIGRAGLEAALRAHDGRAGGSAALLERLEAAFGPAAGLPGHLYPRADRPAVLASFAPEVARCAATDAVAAGILRSAARHIAEAAAAVFPHAPEDLATEPAAHQVALTGGLFGIGEPLLAPVRRELHEQLPDARPTVAAGGPLDGALCVAAALLTDTLLLPADDSLLQVVC